MHATLAGAQNPDEMDVAGFLDQATEYTTTGDVRDSLLKIVQISSRPTRWPRSAPPSCRSGRRDRVSRHPVG